MVGAPAHRVSTNDRSRYLVCKCESWRHDVTLAVARVTVRQRHSVLLLSAGVNVNNLTRMVGLQTLGICMTNCAPVRAAKDTHFWLMKTDSARMSPSRGRSKLGGSRASQKIAARPLPIAATKATCSGSQVSRLAERTLDRCTPMDLRAQVGMRPCAAATCLNSSLQIKLYVFAVCRTYFRLPSMLADGDRSLPLRLHVS